MTYPRYYNARIETMPPRQIQEVQERKLRKQLAYNYQHSAFYRQKFDEVGVHLVVEDRRVRVDPSERDRGTPAMTRLLLELT